MSNHLAIATVTATLRRNLQIVVETDVPQLDAQVTSLRPNAPATELPTTGINLVLYQVTPDPSLRNVDLPTRRSDGSLLARPTAALGLHYLLSFYGNDVRLEPQILLACALRALHASPVLSPSAIDDTLTDPTFSFLAGSDLAAALSLVRFSPTALSLEEMSKLWSIYFQTPYVLSVAYTAGVVLVDSAVSVGAAVPVRAVQLQSLPLLGPVIEAVLPQDGGAPGVVGRPIQPGNVLALRGSGLAAPGTAVLIDGVIQSHGTVSDSELTVALPPGLRAGPHSIQIVRSVDLGSPPTPHAALSSNVGSFVLSPTVTASAGAGAVDVTVTPSVGKAQRVRLLLSQFRVPSGRARSHAFDAPSRNQATTPDETSSLSIPITGVAAGTYLVRLQVDGAESPLGFDETSGFDGPTVIIP